MRKNLIIDTFVVMPNHVHLLMCIQSPPKGICRDALHASPMDRQKGATCNVALQEGGGDVDLTMGKKNVFGPQKNNLASIIRGLKGAITSKIKKTIPAFAWQSSFYEHIIRTDVNFQNAREYIENNPSNRNKDRNNKLDVTF